MRLSRIFRASLTILFSTLLACDGPSPVELAMVPPPQAPPPPTQPDAPARAALADHLGMNDEQAETLELTFMPNGSAMAVGRDPSTGLCASILYTGEDGWLVTHAGFVMPKSPFLFTLLAKGTPGVGGVAAMVDGQEMPIIFERCIEQAPTQSKGQSAQGQ